MALLHYFTPAGLPNPSSSSSPFLSSRAIHEANKEVRRVLNEPKKRGKYHSYDPETRAAIGKYATMNGVAAASSLFTRKLKHTVSKSTVLSIKKQYLEERRSSGFAVTVSSLPLKLRGRPPILGDDLDMKVQLYIRKLRDSGGAVTTRTTISAAKAIVSHYDRSRLKEHGGYIEINRSWALSLLKRMKFVKRKVSTAKSKESVTDFIKRRDDFFCNLVNMVEMEDIPLELILNWDQTGIRLVPSSSWTMERKGSQSVQLTGANDKRQITAVLCGSILGDFLPLQLIYKGSTTRCHPSYEFPEDWSITHSPKHWSNENTMLEYINDIIYPYVKNVRERLGCESPAVVIIDNFKGQVTEDINSLLEFYNIHTCLLPPNTTSSLQPLDVAVNKPVKDFLKRKFDDWYTSQVMEQIQGISDDDIETYNLQPIDLSMARVKEISAEWLVQVSAYIASNPEFLVNGFIKAGITGALDNLPNELHEELELESCVSDSDANSGSDDE